MVAKRRANRSNCIVHWEWESSQENGLGRKHCRGGRSESEGKGGENQRAHNSQQGLHQV